MVAYTLRNMRPSNIQSLRTLHTSRQYKRCGGVNPECLPQTRSRIRQFRFQTSVIVNAPIIPMLIQLGINFLHQARQHLWVGEEMVEQDCQTRGRGV
jgi:hypothetical protein